MTKPKLFVALPCYGDMPAYFTRCLLNLIQEPPCNLVLRMVIGDSLVSRARNTLTADFLRSDCTHLLFIDTDLIFSPEHVGKLVSRKKALIGGFYPKKQDGKLAWVCNAYPGGPGADDRGLQQLRYIGTGFMLIRRDVIEKMQRVYGDELAYRADSSGREEWDFWSVGVHKKSHRYLSEDWMFCQRALDLGFKVWGDARVILKHVGTAVYPLQSQEHAITDPFCWRDISGWFDDWDAACYEHIAQRIPINGRHVEVGVWQGRSLGSFVEACNVHRKRPAIFAVDTFEGTSGEKEHEDVLPIVGGKLRRLFEGNMKKLGARVTTYEMPSRTAARHFKNHSLDSVFIDAGHTAMAVAADIKAWLPKVKRDGVIGGHDFNYPAVKRVVKRHFPNAEAIGRCWFVDLARH